MSPPGRAPWVPFTWKTLPGSDATEEEPSRTPPLLFGFHGGGRGGLRWLSPAQGSYGGADPEGDRTQPASHHPPTGLHQGINTETETFIQTFPHKHISFYLPEVRYAEPSDNYSFGQRGAELWVAEMMGLAECTPLRKRGVGEPTRPPTNLLGSEHLNEPPHSDILRSPGGHISPSQPSAVLQVFQHQLVYPC